MYKYFHWQSVSSEKVPDSERFKDDFLRAHIINMLISNKEVVVGNHMLFILGDFPTILSNI